MRTSIAKLLVLASTLTMSLSACAPGPDPETGSGESQGAQTQAKPMRTLTGKMYTRSNCEEPIVAAGVV